MTKDHYRHKAAPSLARVKELFLYEAKTGLLIRCIKCGNAEAGSIAGSNNGRNFLRVSVDGERYLVHILAWYIKTGIWPSHLIDHKDCDGLNNRWRNLRAASQADNMANKRISSLNKSGFKGVCLDKRRGLYRAEIQKGSFKMFLGYYRTPEDAYAAYLVAAKIVHRKFARG